MNQPLPLVDQLKNLEMLQELDLKIDSLKKDQSSLPASLKTLDDSLNKLNAALDNKNKELNEIEKVKKQTQAALELNQERLTRSNSKLEGVQNSQEFQAANKEIDQLKKLNSSLEEQIKKSETDFTTVKSEVETLTEQTQKLSQEREAKASLVSGKENEVKADIAELTAQRTSFVDKVETRILNQYNRIRAARAGIGIVPAVGGRWKGCNMMVPPQLYNEIHKAATLHSCPSCHRILFVPGQATQTNDGLKSESKVVSA